MLFDPSKTLVVELDDIRKVKVRFPSDEDWAERTRKTKIVRRHLGGERYKDEFITGDGVDSEILARIRKNANGEPLEANGIALDDAEASVVLGELTENDAVGIEQAKDGLIVTLQVLGVFETKHYVSRPSAADVKKRSKAAISTEDEYRQTVSRISLEPSATLYDKIKIATEGYAEGAPIPIIHKETVVSEVIRYMDRHKKVTVDPE